MFNSASFYYGFNQTFRYGEKTHQFLFSRVFLVKYLRVGSYAGHLSFSSDMVVETAKIHMLSNDSTFPIFSPHSVLRWMPFSPIL